MTAKEPSVNASDSQKAECVACIAQRCDKESHDTQPHAMQVDNQKAILARDRAAPNITANVWFYAQFLVSMLLKREDLVPWADQSASRRLARRIIEDKWFNRFVMTIVFVNIVVMAMYHADMSHGFAATLEVGPTCYCHSFLSSALSILFFSNASCQHVACFCKNIGGGSLVETVNAVL